MNAVTSGFAASDGAPALIDEPLVRRDPAPLVQLRGASLRSFERSAGAEWLVCNGLGSFACGSVALASTRRYHGLLVAALAPPVDRRVLVAKCDVIIDYRGRRYALGANEYADGTIDPQGYLLLDSFELDGQTPVWCWRVGDLVVRQRVWMAHGEQCTYLSLDVLSASATATVTLVPFCSGRDYHALHQAHDGIAVSAARGGCVVSMPGCPPCRLEADAATFEERREWHRALAYRVERERGLDWREDLFNPGVFRGELAAGETLNLTCAIGRSVAPPRLAWRDERRRQQALLATLPTMAPAWVRQLALAADQFLVARAAGHSVIAGYPWFTDWGRDTMIALPGLTLATGRLAMACGIVESWARHVDRGLLPNRFPDGGEAPEYNTVDATLWYFLAVAACLARGADAGFASRMYAVLVDIAAWHLRGTRHGIAVDARDGLLAAGVPGTQLTWMDARARGVEVTPRHGKPVEINVLWQCALHVLAELAGRCGQAEDAAAWRQRAAAHAAAFRARYWHSAGWLYDVVDTPTGDDASLRPNQVLAVALAPMLLTRAQATRVVDICVHELWTPQGLRTLAPSHPAYGARYEGPPDQRDAVYHQGTAWAWLLGPLARAHFNVHRDRGAALALLTPLLAQLEDGGLGTLGEIADGDAPHALRGCFAQAWSVGCVLDAWHHVHVAPCTAQFEGETA